MNLYDVTIPGIKATSSEEAINLVRDHMAKATSEIMEWGICEEDDCEDLTHEDSPYCLQHTPEDKDE